MDDRLSEQQDELEPFGLCKFRNQLLVQPKFRPGYPGRYPAHPMTLPKKNRRDIVVDGRKYHWQFDPFRLWGNDSFVCVQDASGRGPLLKMQWVGIALPNHIEAAIRFAHANGWRPNGANILEIGADSNADPVIFRMKPDGALRYWFYDDYYGEYSPRNPNNPNILRRAAEDDSDNAG